LRGEHWGANETEVLLDDTLGVLRGDEEVEVAETASRNGTDADVSTLVIVVDPPILSLSIVVVNTDPAIRRMLVHVEWMHTIHLFSRQLPVLRGIIYVLRPHRVDTCFQE